jgi:AcrR family transcriptional regulator
MWMPQPGAPYRSAGLLTRGSGQRALINACAGSRIGEREGLQMTVWRPSLCRPEYARHSRVRKVGQLVKDKSSTPPASALKCRRVRPAAAPEELQAAHAEARNRICDGALTLFERGGIEAISMREIASLIGASPMMLYKYFRTKDHLLQELRTRAFETFEERLRVSATAGTALGRLRQLSLAYLRFGLVEHQAYKLMFDYWVYDDTAKMLEDFGDAIRRQSGAWDIMSKVVQAYFDEEGLRGDALTAAHLIWAGLHGLVSLEASRKLVMGMQFEELMVPMVEAIISGRARPMDPA